MDETPLDAAFSSKEPLLSKRSPKVRPMNPLVPLLVVFFYMNDAWPVHEAVSGLSMLYWIMSFSFCLDGVALTRCVSVSIVDDSGEFWPNFYLIALGLGVSTMALEMQEDRPGTWVDVASVYGFDERLAASVFALCLSLASCALGALAICYENWWHVDLFVFCALLSLLCSVAYIDADAVERVAFWGGSFFVSFWF